MYPLPEDQHRSVPLPPVQRDHGSTTAPTILKLLKPTRKTRITKARYVNPTGLVAHNDNWFKVSILNLSPALVVADFTFTVANATEIVTATAHGLQTGDGPVRVSNSGGGLPAGLVAVTDYFIYRLGANTFSFCSTRANAYSGVVIDLTTDGTGTHTLVDTASTTRPVVVADGINTDANDSGASIAADTYVDLTLSATDANRVIDTDQEMAALFIEGGTATLPAGTFQFSGIGL